MGDGQTNVIDLVTYGGTTLTDARSEPWGAMVWLDLESLGGLKEVGTSLDWERLFV